MTTNYRDVPELQKYIDLVENEGKNGVKKCCKWQKKLIKFVKKCFENENLTIDTAKKVHGFAKILRFWAV